MRIEVFEFNLYVVGTSDITKTINKFCEEHIVTDIKINNANVGTDTESLFYTVFYKE